MPTEQEPDRGPPRLRTGPPLSQLARAGCRYIQIDAPELLVLWCGGPLAAQLDAAGLPVERIKHEGIDILNYIAAAAPGVFYLGQVLGMHRCYPPP